MAALWQFNMVPKISAIEKGVGEMYIIPTKRPVCIGGINPICGGDGGGGGGGEASDGVPWPLKRKLNPWRSILKLGFEFAVTRLNTNAEIKPTAPIAIAG